MVGEDGGFGSGIGAFLFLVLKVVRKAPGIWITVRLFFSLSPWSNVALVDSLNDLQRGGFIVKALPPESEQLAWAKCVALR